MNVRIAVSLLLLYGPMNMQTEFLIKQASKLTSLVR